MLGKYLHKLGFHVWQLPKNKDFLCLSERRISTIDICRVTLCSVVSLLAGLVVQIVKLTIGTEMAGEPEEFMTLLALVGVALACCVERIA